MKPNYRVRNHIASREHVLTNRIPCYKELQLISALVAKRFGCLSIDHESWRIGDNYLGSQAYSPRHKRLYVFRLVVSVQKDCSRNKSVYIRMCIASLTLKKL